MTGWRQSLLRAGSGFRMIRRELLIQPGMKSRLGEQHFYVVFACNLDLVINNRF